VVTDPIAVVKLLPVTSATDTASTSLMAVDNNKPVTVTFASATGISSPIAVVN
jgi:hypothetical protein